MRQHFKKLLVAPALVLGIFSGLFIASNHSTVERVSLTIGKIYPVDIPNHLLANSAMTYAQELEAFSAQIVRAFGVSKEKATRYAPMIIEAEINTGLSEIHIASLIMTESSFDESARSSVGALGLTQIRPIYWGDFCNAYGHDLYQPKGNVLCGATIVTFLKSKYCHGQLKCALEHYNVGRGNLLAHMKYRQAGQRYNRKVNYYSQRLSAYKSL